MCINPLFSYTLLRRKNKKADRHSKGCLSAENSETSDQPSFVLRQDGLSELSDSILNTFS